MLGFLQRNSTTVYFGFLTLALLCVNGPLARALPQVGGYWILALVGLMLVSAIRAWFCSFNEDSSFPIYRVLLGFYALMIIVSSGMHFVGLSMIPADTQVNSIGMQALQAMKQERAFALLYLMFPLMLLVHITVQGRLNLLGVVRCFAVAAALTLSVALYQAWVDAGFMHESLWAIRFEGLATDPNALALTCFLLLPLMIAGILIETRHVFRYTYAILTGMLLMAMMHTGSRTGLAGVLVLFVVSPWVVAVCMRKWKKRWRVALALSPVIMVLIAALFSSALLPLIDKSGHAGHRMALTWQKAGDVGLQGLLSGNEDRGKYFLLSMDLIQEAPFGGWGPAGYYRESSNMYYHSEGWKQRLWSYYPRDSALNHYLMIAGDFGIPVAVLNLLLVLLPLWLGFLSYRHFADDRTRLVSGLLLASNVVFMLMILTVPPSYFLGVCWIWTAQLAALLLMAGQNGASLSCSRHILVRRGLTVVGIVILLTVVVGGYETSFGDYGYAVRAEQPWWKSD